MRALNFGAILLTHRVGRINFSFVSFNRVEGCEEGAREREEEVELLVVKVQFGSTSLLAASLTHKTFKIYDLLQLP